MAQYSISEVEELTGIKAHTLRVWERRYDLIAAKRTDTKIRFYDDDQLKKLLNIGILLDNGYKVSKLNNMPNEEIDQKVYQLLDDKNGSSATEVQGLVSCMLSLDEPMFHKIYEGSVARIGVVKTVTDLIYPFLFKVGILWGANQSMPAQEHFVSNLIRRKIDAATNELDVAPDSAGRVVLFLPESEFHEIGLLLANYISRQMGFRTYYLGQNVPNEDVVYVANEVNPDLIVTILIMWKDHFRESLKEIQFKTNCQIAIGGRLPQDMRDKKSMFMEFGHPDELSEFLGTNK